MDALANLRAEIRGVETGGRESQRGVHDQSDADLAPTRFADPDQPVTTAVAECNRPLDKLHNSVGNRIVEEIPICGPAQEPEIIRDVRQHCEAHQRRPPSSSWVSALSCV